MGFYAVEFRCSFFGMAHVYIIRCVYIITLLKMCENLEGTKKGITRSRLHWHALHYLYLALVYREENNILSRCLALHAM